jgi:hypothetical protein
MAASIAGPDGKDGQGWKRPFQTYFKTPVKTYSTMLANSYLKYFQGKIVVVIEQLLMVFRQVLDQSNRHT